MPLKPALSIHDQVELLQSRGMVCSDILAAARFLQHNNYYRLNVYFHKLMDSPDHFQSGTRFDQVIDIYNNDSWLRNKILTILEPIEISLRTQISYHLSTTYGSDAFYRRDIFKNEKIYQKNLRDFQKAVDRNQEDPVVCHHQEKYAGEFPIWVIVEFLSFNTMSMLYSNLLEKDKKRIAMNSYHVNEYHLGIWFYSLGVLRNICAHYGYLYRRELPVPLKISKIVRSCNCDVINSRSLFARILIMYRLSSPAIWQPFIQFICDKEQLSPSFDLRDYGFPRDWQRFLN